MAHRKRKPAVADSKSFQYQIAVAIERSARGSFERAQVHYKADLDNKNSAQRYTSREDDFLFLDVSKTYLSKHKLPHKVTGPLRVLDVLK